jgi:hypothetical protein
MECEKSNAIYNQLELSLKTINSDVTVTKSDNDIVIRYIHDPKRNEIVRIYTLLHRYQKKFRKINDYVCIGMEMRF